MNTANTTALRINAASAMFPALPDADRIALEDSIRVNGIMQPLILNADGEVIDGRHRLAAAIALGLPTVPVVTVTGNEVDAAISANMDRRVMTPSQRAALAVSLMPSSGRAANAAAAARFHVSPAIIAAAVRLVAAAGRDVLPSIIAGDVSIWSALRANGAQYARAATPAPVAVAVEVAAPVVPVESAPVPAGLTADVAAIVAAFAAGQDVAAAMRGATVTADALDALATYLFAAADIAAQRA
jgi:hypothetical protein